uniref:Uncharacterized protein n=1 Tax=Toxoplasma gondii TgCATBr9 TaxID=943120 RepID=A0A2T6IYN5_TOXGO|nr:hypothetical protein TGBR9_381420 [Toxoplasma gondii TgCATBr9]
MKVRHPQESKQCSRACDIELRACARFLGSRRSGTTGLALCSFLFVSFPRGSGGSLLPPPPRVFLRRRTDTSARGSPVGDGVQAGIPRLLAERTTQRQLSRLRHRNGRKENTRCNCESQSTRRWRVADSAWFFARPRRGQGGL